MLDRLVENWPILAGVLAMLGVANRDALSQIGKMLGGLRTSSIVIEGRDERLDAFEELLALQRRLESFGLAPPQLACFDELAKAIRAHQSDKAQP